MSGKCEICGNSVDKLDILIIEGAPKVCSECSRKYEKLKKGEIQAEEMISEYTSEKIANELKKRVAIIKDNANKNQMVESQKNDATEYMMKNSDSTVGKIIKSLSLIVLILSTIGALVIMVNVEVSIGLAVLLIDLLFGMVSYGIGEICSLLASINSKM